MSFSIIIPTKDSLNAFSKTFESLMQSPPDQNYEVIVINDSHSLSISRFISQQENTGFPVKEILNEKPSGSYKARNLGINKAQFEWLLFIDDSLHISKNWYQHVEAYLQDFDFICTNVQFSEKPLETLAEKYCRVYGFRAKEKYDRQGFGLTTFLLVRKKIFRELGLFDERLYSGGDFEFSQRVRESSFNQIFLEDVVITHEPLGWKNQFLKMTRILKGRNDLAKFYPNDYGHLKTKKLDLLRTLKYLYQDLVFYKRTKFYQSGEVNWLQHQVGQICYYSLYLTAQILVLLFPKKRFNW